MLKEVITYYSDTEPTIVEMEDLKRRSILECKVFFVEFYSTDRDQIMSLEFNNGEVSVREQGTVVLKKHYKEEVSEGTLTRLMKKLRDETGMGLLDCKAALLNNNCDLEASKEWLRKKGLA